MGYGREVGEEKEQREGGQGGSRETQKLPLGEQGEKERERESFLIWFC